MDRTTSWLATTGTTIIARPTTYQSGSGFRILGTTSIVRGTDVFPVFQSGLTAIVQTPILQESEGTDLRTHSLFLNDEWRYNGRITLNLGLRWDKNKGEDAAGRPVSNSSKISPRLGIVIDPKGDGRWTASASVARYVSSLNSAISEVSPAGNPAVYQWNYLGPSINPDPTAPTLVGTEAALTQVFDWLNANGGTNRPRDLTSLPGVNTQINGALDSPNANEFAFGLSRQLGRRGSVRADFVLPQVRRLLRPADRSDDRSSDQRVGPGVRSHARGEYESG